MKSFILYLITFCFLEICPSWAAIEEDTSSSDESVVIPDLRTVTSQIGTEINPEDIDYVYLPHHGDKLTLMIMELDARVKVGNFLVFRQVEKILNDTAGKSLIGLNYTCKNEAGGDFVTDRLTKVKAVWTHQQSKTPSRWMRDFGKMLYVRRKGDDQRFYPTILNLIADPHQQDTNQLAQFVSQRLSLPTVDLGLARDLSGNRGGNIDSTPNGVLYFGDNLDPKLKEFFLIKGYQERSTELFSSWLHVGHVDEMLSFVMPPPSGNPVNKCPFVLVKASPALAIEKTISLVKGLKNPNEFFRSLKDQIHPALRGEKEINKFTLMLLLAIRGEEESFVLESLKSPELNLDDPALIDELIGLRSSFKDDWIEFMQDQHLYESYIQENINRLKNKIATFTPDCAELSVIEFPQFYKKSTPAKFEEVLARDPLSTQETYQNYYLKGFKPLAKPFGSNSVNFTVIDQQLLVPQPLFKDFQQQIDQDLRSYGLNPHFLDTYNAYSKLEGDIHCGTFDCRQLPEALILD